MNVIPLMGKPRKSHLQDEILCTRQLIPNGTWKLLLMSVPSLRISGINNNKMIASIIAKGTKEGNNLAYKSCLPTS